MTQTMIGGMRRSGSRVGAGEDDLARWATLARRDARLRPSACMLMHEIADDAQRGEGCCRTGQEKLGARIGVSRRAVNAYVRQGREAGYLEVQHLLSGGPVLIWPTWPGRED